MLRPIVVLLLGSLYCSVANNVKPWKAFVLAQQWTPSVCVDGHKQHINCHIPESVQGWTLHGLWPNYGPGHESGPECCNQSYPFKWQEVQSLNTSLWKQWPNVFLHGHCTEFWSHEWNTHGTCATSVSATRSEFLFFKKALDLNRKYDIDSAFDGCKIVPSNTTSYKPSAIESCLKNHFGVEPVIACNFDPSTHKQILEEVRLCMNKSFILENCESSPLSLRPGWRENCSSPRSQGSDMTTPLSDPMPCKEEPVYIYPLPHQGINFNFS